jgi:hypothetical protein
MPFRRIGGRVAPGAENKYEGANYFLHWVYEVDAVCIEKVTVRLIFQASRKCQIGFHGKNNTQEN